MSKHDIVELKENGVSVEHRQPQKSFPNFLFHMEAVLASVAFGLSGYSYSTGWQISSIHSLWAVLLFL